ncbi:MAG TPA: hypothetical protein VNP95_04825 [Thermomicrobiales bacterium]|nr:hypothetical protein [Thermomicrobiales bacterium]
MVTHRPVAGRGGDPDSGPATFGGYRRGVDEIIARDDPRIGRLDLALAIGGNLAAIGFGFAPWLRYQALQRDGTSFAPARDTGYATDAWVLLAASIVAIVAFGIAAVQADQALSATVGFWASVIAFLTAGTCWWLADMTAPDGATAVHAEWGVVAATAATLVAVIFAFRAMRTARIY